MQEALNFGIDCIEAVQQINRDFDQNLAIRVGVNTGGPLVAGVLGMGKPTFEIFGPVIEIAGAMEHHGVKNQVQISRHVYELVYGDLFVIKERELIEVNGAQVQTYLAERKK